MTTGPLGQGIANAFGMAVAEAYLNARFGAGVVDHHTYAFVGDGCLQEGVGQEMISLAGHLRLGKLILLWDDNRITDDGATDLSISEDVAARFRVAGWHVVEVDGHDLEAVSAAIGAAKADPRPSLIACRTVIAQGIARLQGQRGGHSAKLFPEDADAAREQLGWSSPAVRGAGRRAGRLARRRPSQHRRARGWQRARGGAAARPKRAEFERIVAGELPEGWRDVLLDYKRGALERGAARRAASSISAEINDLLVDAHARAHGRLRRPRGAHQPQAPPDAPSRREDRSGAYVHCGVREHVMGAMANGMAAHGGVVPLARHLPRLLRLRAPGDAHGRADGAAGEVRVQPRLDRHRPQRADAPAGRDPGVAARDAQHAGAAPGRCGRGGRVLGDRARASQRARRRWSSRARRCRTCARMHTSANLSRRGAYVLAEADGGPREVTLLATGSEVALALAARDALQADGTPTAVVSMPSWELFAAQDAGLPGERARPRHRARAAARPRCASAGTAGSASAAASSA